MNYNFFVLKFLFFIFLNFLFIFQSFFSLNFLFSSRIDEELIICFAIFFVFILFITQIVNSLQDMLKTRIDLYVNVFLLVFKLIRKSLKRFKKHSSKTLSMKNVFLAHVSTIFFKNLSVFYSLQVALNAYVLNLRFKVLVESLKVDSELKSVLDKEASVKAYELELLYFKLLRAF